MQMTSKKKLILEIEFGVVILFIAIFIAFKSCHKSKFREQEAIDEEEQLQEPLTRSITQNCSDPNCPFNNVQMDGPTDIPYMGGYGIYSLPNVVYGAKYVWTSSFLTMPFWGNGKAQFEVAPDILPPENSGGIAYCYHEWDFDLDKYKRICKESTYTWWYPRDVIDYIECTITYDGHTHYFYKQVFIWKYFSSAPEESVESEELNDRYTNYLNKQKLIWKYFDDE